MKKLFALLLALAVLFTMLPCKALADGLFDVNVKQSVSETDTAAASSESQALQCTAEPEPGPDVRAIEGTYENFKYSIENDEVTITGYVNEPTGALTIPETIDGYPVTGIGYRAFYDCVQLTSVEMPNVYTIGWDAFYNCTALTSVEMPNVHTIGQDAFRWCDSLASVEMPNVQTIGDCAFFICDSLTSVEMPNVETIGNAAFYYCESLTSAEMPNVKTIGDSAFYDCDSLTSAKMSNVESIGDSAFYDCDSLTSVEMPNVKTIGDKAFYTCKSLTSAEMPNVETIGDEAFYNCESLTSVEMPNVQTIGDYAFYVCDSLTSVGMPNVQTIGGWAFAHCDSLTSVEMPNVQTIGDYAFYGVPLTSVEIPNVQTIGDFVFYDCDSLTSVEMPNVETIGYSAFGGCDSLTSVEMPNVETIGGYAFYDCDSLTSVEMPNVQTICYWAFSDCDSLTSVEIPNVQTIGDYAFSDCTSLTSVEMPNVETIGASAFEDCLSLTSAYFYSDAPTSFGTNVFYWCASGFTIYYAKGTSGWTTPTWNGYPTQEFDYHPEYEVEDKAITINVQDISGRPVTDAKVYVYEKNVCFSTSKVVAQAKHVHDGVYEINCSGDAFNKNLYVYAFRDTAVSANDTMVYEGRTYDNYRNKARSSFTYTDKSGVRKENVRYIVREHSAGFNNEKTLVLQTLKDNCFLTLNNVQLRVNLSIGYYHKKNDDYKDSIIETMKFADEYLMQATNGIVAINDIAIFGTTNQKDFKVVAKKGQLQEPAIPAVCDIQISKLSGITSHAYPCRFLVDCDTPFIGGQTGKLTFGKAQFSKVSHINFDITKNSRSFAKGITHELGHYILCLKDEYMNGEDTHWIQDDGIFGRLELFFGYCPRPDGALDNFGLMEDEYADVEMSVRDDYAYFRSLSAANRIDKWMTAQYKWATVDQGYEGGSCWEWFAYVMNIQFNSDLGTQGIEYITPANARYTGAYFSNLQVTESRNASQTKGYDLLVEESDSVLALINAEQNSNGSCNLTVNTFGDSIPKLYIDENGGSNLVQLTVEKVSDNIYCVNDISVSDEEDVEIICVMDDAYSSFTLSYRTGEETITCDDEYTSVKLTYGDGTVGSQYMISQCGSYTNGNLTALSLPVYVCAATDGIAEGKVSGFFNMNDNADYTALSWYKMTDGEWVALETTIGMDESTIFKAVCDFNGDGFYALMAGVPDSAGTIDAPTDFSVTTDNTTDGAVKLSFKSADTAIKNYLYVSSAPFTQNTLDKTDKILVTSSTIVLEKTGELYYFALQSVSSTGAESELTDMISCNSGARCTEGSKIPVWWVEQYGLNINAAEDFVCDDEDADNDGLTNLQEFTLGTDPTNADTDGDTVPDAYEYTLELNPLSKMSDGITPDALVAFGECDLAVGAVKVETVGDERTVCFNVENLSENTAMNVPVLLSLSAEKSYTWHLNICGKESVTLSYTFTQSTNEDTFTVAIDNERVTADSDFTNNALTFKSSYTVTLIDGLTNEIISNLTVNMGNDVEFQTPPEHEGYTFTGWDSDGKNITADTTITALYEIKTYTVTYLDGITGEVISTATVEHGADAVFPTPPEHEGYTFAGWDSDGTNITADTTITALYEENTSAILGDANGDGVINGKDVTLIRRYITGGYDVEIILEAADINGDGVINGKDITLLRRLIVGGYGDVA